MRKRRGDQRQKCGSKREEMQWDERVRGGEKKAKSADTEFRCYSAVLTFSLEKDLSLF